MCVCVCVCVCSNVSFFFFFNVYQASTELLPLKQYFLSLLLRPFITIQPIPESYQTLLTENLGKHCRHWPAGKTFLIQENGKYTQDLIMYTEGSFTKDQSGWGFTGKQGATTIHEDSAAYEDTTSILTTEVEAITHALRWIASRGDSQTTHAIIFTDSMSLLRKVEWKY